AEGMLFSGGLDTCILAALGPQIRAINVALDDFSTDLSYAKTMEKIFNLKIHYLRITTDEAIKAIPEVIRILKSFDPAIPNDITVYFGLKYAQELGLKSMMTGDGADEIFAGYDYMQNISDLNRYVRCVVKQINFSSNVLGEFLGIEVKQPYLNKTFVDFSVNRVPVELKLAKNNGVIWGKWILRKAYENILPKSIIWQSKRPLEYGSGTTYLRKIISDKISDKEYAWKQRLYKIKFITKDHLYYYEIYKDVVGLIPQAGKGEKQCSGCGTGMRADAYHCRICGHCERSNQ
ncbi:hypothetical protein KA005_05870, partial [bacterium]|nr:hypothetical protein [bacterium]